MESILNIQSDFQNFSQFSPHKDFANMKETIQFEITNHRKPEEDSFDEASEDDETNNISREYEKVNSLESIVKNIIDTVIKDIVNILSSNKKIEDSKIKNLKSKVNEMIQNNNLEAIDIINILTEKLKDLITVISALIEESKRLYSREPLLYSN